MSPVADKCKWCDTALEVAGHGAHGLAIMWCSHCDEPCPAGAAKSWRRCKLVEARS